MSELGLLRAAALVWSALVASGIQALAGTSEIDRASRIRILESNRPKVTYGVRIAPPWPDGGHLHVNLPEHLEISAGGAGILRWSDKNKGQKAGWTVSADGLSATLDAPSVTIPGSSVKGAIRVVGKDRVEITMLITNRSRRRFPGIKPLYCFQYKDLKGFPRWIGNFEHSYVVQGGRLVLLSEAVTSTPPKNYIRAAVNGSGVPLTRKDALITKGVDVALAAVTSLDGRRKLVFGWTPGKSILSNRSIPCIHADPFYGELRPSQARNVLCTIVFTEEPLDATVARLLKEGIGLPVARLKPEKVREIQQYGVR